MDITKRTIPAMNAVEGFNPAEFTRQLPNDDGSMSLYLDVKYRLLWFRLHHPDGKIDSQIVHVDDKSAVVCCRLYADKKDADDQFVAKSCAQRYATQEKYGDRYLEVAETAAMGRVLAAAGYGTQFCGNTDLMDDIIVDSPLEMGDEHENVFSPEDHEPGAVVVQTKTVVQQPVMQHRETTPQPLHTLEDYLNSMTLEDAKNVVVDVGIYAGTKLGEIVMSKPKDLEWYVKYYAGKNLALKAGAILLMQAATAKAG